MECYVIHCLLIVDLLESVNLKALRNIHCSLLISNRTYIPYLHYHN